MDNIPVHFQMRAVNDVLFDQLDRQLLERANRQLEAWVMPSPGHNDTGVTRLSGLLYVDQGLMKVAKQMHALITNQTTPTVTDRRIARELLRDLRGFQACNTAKYYPGAGEPELKVLIKWIVYEVH